MKKISRIKKIVYIFFTLFVFGSFIVTYVAIKKKCEDLVKQIVLTEEELEDNNVRKNHLIARYQNLASEERIISIATYELGMVIEDPPIEIVTLDAEQISELHNLVQESYD
ncbi:MAG: hypothetical protein HXY50_08185 [Ignavibacteriaceae bacterium]|nr:hypothetical protein [Ignavibacteriaceae bacterium]